jgi:hypothetical protein
LDRTIPLEWIRAGEKSGGLTISVSLDARIFFNVFAAALSPRVIMAPNCTFWLHGGPDSFQNGPKSGRNGVPLDIPSGGSVQNILKKVKKRLVSPLEPR